MVIWRILISALAISWVPFLLGMLLGRNDRLKGRSE
jgi:hypothetical protein